MLPFMLLMQAAAQDPARWGPILDSLGPQFAPGAVVPGLQRIAQGGSGLFGQPPGGQSLTPEGAPGTGGAPPPTTPPAPPPAPGAPPPINPSLQSFFENPPPLPLPPRTITSMRLGDQESPPAPAPTPGTFSPAGMPAMDDATMSALASSMLGLPPTAGAPAPAPVGSPLESLTSREAMLPPVPGNLQPSPMAMGLPPELAAALNAGRPEAMADPVMAALQSMIPPGGPPPTTPPPGGPPPTMRQQVPPQVRMPTAPSPQFHAGVTGAQKAPEMGVQVSTGGTPAQILLATMLSAARGGQDPLRVPTLAQLFGGM